jgi:hypothetical protein
VFRKRLGLWRWKVSGTPVAERSYMDQIICHDQEPWA